MADGDQLRTKRNGAHVVHAKAADADGAESLPLANQQIKGRVAAPILSLH
jgi:hypothetical protein